MTFVQVQFAIDDDATGDAIVEALLDGRLAACCQRVGPVTSRYRWQGTLETATEWLYLCKASPEQLGAAVATIRRLHPYETPEIIWTEADGSPDYVAWVVAETTHGA